MRVLDTLPEWRVGGLYIRPRPTTNSPGYNDSEIGIIVESIGEDGKVTARRYRKHEDSITYFRIFWFPAKNNNPDEYREVVSD